MSFGRGGRVGVGGAGGTNVGGVEGGVPLGRGGGDEVIGQPGGMGGIVWNGFRESESAGEVNVINRKTEFSISITIFQSNLN